MAYPANWTLLQTFTIPHAKVSGGANHADFPFVMADSNFTPYTYANMDDGGGDLRISSDGAGASQLSIEPVDFDTGNEEAEVWIKDELDHDDDTVVYIWGKNTGQSQPAIDAAFGAESVWKAGYKGVWHLTGLLDSTLNDNDLTNDGGAAGAGKIGGAYTLEEANDDNLSAADSASLSITGDMTLEFQLSLGSLTNNMQFITHSDFGIPSYGFNVDLSSDKMRFRYIQAGGSSQSRAVADNAFTDPADLDVWKHVFCAIDVSAKTFTWLIDGVAFAHTVDQTAAANINDSSAKWGIGTQYENTAISGNQLEGSIDEVRVYSGLLTSDWGITSYNNQNDPANFGIAEDVPPSGGMMLGGGFL